MKSKIPYKISYCRIRTGIPEDRLVNMNYTEMLYYSYPLEQKDLFSLKYALAYLNPTGEE